MTDSEIEDLQNQLRDLTIEFRTRTENIDRRLREIRRSRRTQRRREATRDSSSEEETGRGPEVQLGNIVRIVNGYKNQRGTVGEVIRISSGRQQRVTIRDRLGREYTRAPWNLVLVE